MVDEQGLALNTIHELHALDGLRRLPDQSVDCVLTSPPYWAKRDYGTPAIEWPDREVCSLGLERDFTSYIRHLLFVLSEVRRVLKDTGTFWVNLADTYAGSWGNYAPNGIKGHQRPRTERGRRWIRRGAAQRTLRPPSSFDQLVRRKSLCMIPERLALGMLEQGWRLRNVVIWHKPNHMPSSVKDRLTNAWEYLYLFTTQDRYYFDLDALRQPHKSLSGRRRFRSTDITQPRPSPHVTGRRLPPHPGQPQGLHPKGKNPGDVWSIPTRPFRGAHFAVFPEALCQRPIRAGCPPNGVVLDPFAGSGTTLVVAKRLGRRYLGFELNAEYVKLARQRLQQL